MPTPAGVPVAMRSPGSRVMYVLTQAMSCATGKIIRGATVLMAHAVNLEPQIELLRIADLIGADQPRAHRAEGVAPLALVPGAATLDLVFALGGIIEQTVPGDIADASWVPRSRRCDPITTPSSTSQSLLREPRGSTKASSGPLRQLMAFMKIPVRAAV